MIETTFKIDNVQIEFEGFEEPSMKMAEEALKYAEEHKENEKFVISSMKVTKNGSEAEFHVNYKDEDQPQFGRIRRITG